MKLSSQWKILNRDQRHAWNAWAKSNPVLLDNGSFRRVSGHKAMTMVLRNRTVTGEAASPAVVPAAAAWLDGSLSLRDAGPYTRNAGYVGFRVEAALSAGTKWFVWATPPLDGGEVNPWRHLKFVKCLTLGVLAYDDVIPTFGADYLAVNGDWRGPGVDGVWPADKFIWFRLHHYANGQLSPGVMMPHNIIAEEL
jgi:hypothetical protein